MSSLREQKYYTHLESIPVASDDIFQYILATFDQQNIRLSWQLNPDAPEIVDNKFEIYRNENFGEPQNWQKVGEVINDWTFLDESLILQIKTTDHIRYKIRVQIPEEHFSPEVSIYPQLTVRERLILRSLLRRKLITLKSLPRFEGYLFKRMWKGERCECVDVLTGEVTNSDCPSCFGTGIISGYWKYGKPCPIIVSGPFTTTINFDFQNLFLGTIQPSQVEAIFPAIYPITIFDVWIPKTKFSRFYIVQTAVESEFKGIPLGWKVIMRAATKSDVIYSLDLEE